MVELTEKQQEIFEKVKATWEERGGKGNVDEERLKRIIIVADTDKDGLKRISLIGSDKIHLVPIEEIILNGLKSSDVDKYPMDDLSVRNHRKEGIGFLGGRINGLETGKSI